MVGGKGNLAARRYAVMRFLRLFFAHRAINSDISAAPYYNRGRLWQIDLDCQAPCYMRSARLVNGKESSSALCETIYSVTHFYSRVPLAGRVEAKN